MGVFQCRRQVQGISLATKGDLGSISAKILTNRVFSGAILDFCTDKLIQIKFRNWKLCDALYVRISFTYLKRGKTDFWGGYPPPPLPPFSSSHVEFFSKTLKNLSVKSFKWTKSIHKRWRVTKYALIDFTFLALCRLSTRGTWDWI